MDRNIIEDKELKHDRVIEIYNAAAILKLKFKHAHCVDDQVLQKIANNESLVESVSFISSQDHCDLIGTHISCTNLTGHLRLVYTDQEVIKIHCFSTCFDFELEYRSLIS